jgi:glycosyltransferase involved in cell wall biosynthesis
MNICIESQLLNHPRRSGVMTYAEGLVKGLSQNDLKNNYALAYYSLKRRPEDMPGPTNGNFAKTVLPIPDREFLGRQWLIDNLALPKFFKQNNVKIFHRPSGYTMPSLKNIFKVLTIHDLRTLTIGDKVWTQNIEKYKKAIESVDICAVVSECTKKDLMEHMKVSEKKIRVTYLGADERYRPATQQKISDTKLKYGIGERFLFSIGSVPRKNIDGIIRGFAGSKIMSDFLLVLGCKFELEKYQALAQELSVGKRVIILKNLSDDDTVALYSGCQGFVFPSLYEGFGLPILEAMNCGAPVITSNLSSCPEVAGDAAVLVDPSRTDEISDAMNQICQNEQLRRDLIAKGFQRAKLFSWQEFAGQMKKIYAMAE